MLNFHETKYGKIFFESQLPSLIKNLGRIADVLEKEKNTLNIHQDTMSSEIWANLSVRQRDDIYRMAWFDNVYEDVEGQLKQNPNAPDNEQDFNSLCSDVANAYVYDGKYDCNIPYWDNINNLIESCMEKRIYTNIPCTISGHSVTVVTVIAPSWPQAEITDLIAVCEDGSRHPLEEIYDEKGKPLAAYEEYISEWFRSLYKEQTYKGVKPFHTEYQFTEMGQEYWYQNNDFKKHFTCCEG